MIINIATKDIDSTKAIQEYITGKVESLAKFFDNIQQVDVVVGMNGHHHNKGSVFFAEMNVHVPGHKVFVKKEAEDMYKAVDKVKDHLKVDLEKMKGKMRRFDQDELRDQKAYHEEDPS
ncbi:MAG: ribosomal subunit interface protein [Candidatus Magasanikbacteria bacterium CG10_big_fil_rev_8_21_14_0_10_43_6]|uniref:Ribosomal subunit interface protein n=1 Tax=Candidatus Magasanikbacteria bacterium CG10_big_fil_rev_8_21_14_0_10_43_6 TaxID=1974650 RepID=A0A2M6W0R0_9BACT|nr:MAG: ribosomal subunit interface protein [Candidatus Magasanikbacteria bacterium CG10_big_fil_rev_8_21_14_0_10_43_6]